MVSLVSYTLSTSGHWMARYVALDCHPSSIMLYFITFARQSVNGLSVGNDSLELSESLWRKFPTVGEIWSRIYDQLLTRLYLLSIMPWVLLARLDRLILLTSPTVGKWLVGWQWFTWIVRAKSLWRKFPTVGEIWIRIHDQLLTRLYLLSIMSWVLLARLDRLILLASPTVGVFQ